MNENKSQQFIWVDKVDYFMKKKLKKVVIYVLTGLTITIALVEGVDFLLATSGGKSLTSVGTAIHVQHRYSSLTGFKIEANGGLNLDEMTYNEKARSSLAMAMISTELNIPLEDIERYIRESGSSRLL